MVHVPGIYNAFDPNYVFLCSFIPFYDLKVSITLLTEKFRVAGKIYTMFEKGINNSQNI